MNIMNYNNIGNSLSSANVIDLFQNMHNREKGDNFNPYDLGYKVGGLYDRERINKHQLDKQASLDIFGSPNRALLNKQSILSAQNSYIKQHSQRDYSQESYEGSNSKK